MADEKDPPVPEDPDNAGGAKKQPQPESWISSLARRSSGLPADETPVSRSESKGTSGLLKTAGIGIQLAGTVAIFAFIGYEMDRRMGWSPWGLITLVLMAVVGNMYLLIKESLKEDRDSAKKK